MTPATPDPQPVDPDVGEQTLPARAPSQASTEATDPPSDVWQVGEPGEDEPPISDVWEFGGPVDFNAQPAADDDGTDDDLELPPREWGTTVTVILLVLLSAAAVASVVLRQQGIELHWPWSEPQAPTPSSR